MVWIIVLCQPKKKHLGVSLSPSISSSLPYFACTTADGAFAHRLCSRTAPPFVIIFKGIVHNCVIYVVPNLYDFFFIVLVLFHANSLHGGWHFWVSKRWHRKVKVSKTWSIWLMRLNSCLVNSDNWFMRGTGQNMSLKTSCSVSVNLIEFMSKSFRPVLRTRLNRPIPSQIVQFLKRWFYSLTDCKMAEKIYRRISLWLGGGLFWLGP